MNTALFCARGARRVLSVAVLGLLPALASAQATPEQIQTLPGFKVELLLKADKAKDGSWISMAKDPKGRLLLAGQSGQPITRVSVANGEVKAEKLKLPLSEAMGMLYAFDSLYVNALGPNDQGKRVFGMFRCRDTDGDDQFDKVEFLREWKGGSGEHGAHGIVLGPDKKLYVVCGNFVEVPTDLISSSPHKNYQDDRVLPRAEDGNGFGAGKKPPGGFIVRLDENGKDAELFASGQRNTYDIAFNADGELLGYDSDMEWDWGMPWYRPTRVFHAISGADHGFREGSAKWPEYYPDSLPAVVNIGVGCPTGVVTGTGAKFPAKYQKALYILDWTYGRLIAVHEQAKGATYTATWENFVAPASLHANSGKVPLNLTDAVIGDDGAMYFTIGGRNTQAALYRVTYTGNESTAAADLHEAQGAEARAARKKLEAFDGRVDPQAVEAAWPYLGSEDRALRYAARIALESQPVEQWKSKVLEEKQPQAALTGLLALARLGGKEMQPQVLSALAKLPMSGLNEQQKLEKVRIIQVSISRNGKPAGELAKQIVDELSASFPSTDTAMNLEVCQVLLALDAPGAVAGTMKALAEAKSQEEQIGYIHHLRTISAGWTPELRKAYFGWFAGNRNKQHPSEVVKWFGDAGRAYGDGASFPKFIANFFSDAKKTLSPDMEQALAEVLSQYAPPQQQQARRNQPRPRAVVRQWAVADLEGQLAQVGKGRRFDRGKQMYEVAQCSQCHKFGNDGGAVGPDLTAVSSRFTRKDILDSIIEPSKVISEQYQNMTVRLKNNDAVEGRILEDTADKVVVQPNPLKPEKVTVKKSEVKSIKPSKVSPMPSNLVDTLTKDEILDLLAYMESAGRKDHPDFAK